MDFKEEKRIYDRARESGSITKSDRFIFDHWFCPNGKIRSSEPDRHVFLSNIAKSLSRDVGISHQEAFGVVEKGLIAGKRKIQMLSAAYPNKESWDQGIANSRLGWGVVRLLLQANITSKVSLRSISDSKLLAFDGIGAGRLAQIRKLFPEYERPKLDAGQIQGSLHL